ncbi:MAG: MerR family transcriptional regulator [Lachnospiraceae bacterium]|nr:MerR family transcriptional regulator [Lachnospiraceae bacterium]
MNTSNIKNYKPKDFAELTGVSVKNLQRWDREGTLKANRTPTEGVITLTTNIFNLKV